MKHIFLLLLIFLLFPSIVEATSFRYKQKQTIDSFLNSLDHEIAHEAFYSARKDSSIRQLKSLYVNEKDIYRRILINESMYKEYRYYKYDSIIVYTNKNLALIKKTNNADLIDKTKLYLSDVYMDNGVFWEAENTINQINSATLSDDLYKVYHELKAKLYYYLFRSSNDDINTEKYLNLFDGTTTALKDSGYKLQDISPQVQFDYS